MRDFGRRCFAGLLAAVGACQDDGEALTQPTGKGGPNEPGGDPPGPQPSPTSTPPTTGAGTSSGETGVGSTSGGLATTGGEEAGSSSGTTETPVPEGCGDGEVDPGEACDDGFGGNSDNAACTSTCAAAVCGDGLLWAGQEECDHGANNNDNSYGACTESCIYGARCGDGVLQADHEECDASAPPVEGEAACDPAACRYLARVAFVTAAQSSGALGGLALADAACMAAAAGQGLDQSGSFRAWLSDGVATPKTRLKKAAADPGYPYVRLDGQLLADDLEDLVAHGPKVPLDVTETGATLKPLELVWTNIGADGEPFSAVNHCAEWTSSSFLVSARVGKVSPATMAELPAWRAARRWTSDVTQPCQFSAHLYCLED